MNQVSIIKVAVTCALAGVCLSGFAQDHELTTDVVVVGGGISGLSSAMSVLDHGGKVVVLEQLPGLDGAGNYFEGAFAADSDYKRRNGLTEPTADQVYKDVVRFYNYRINAVVLRTLINESGPAMDWIETKGYKFKLNKRGKKDRHMAPDGFGAGFIKLFYRDIEKNGGTILLETPAQKLIQNEKGEVVGVEAKNHKGEKVTVRAKAVILATGGFPGNQEMLKKYVPDIGKEGMARIMLRGPGIEGRTGDGINMAKEIGADLAGMDTIAGNSPYLEYEPVIFQFNGPQWLKESRAALSQPFLWVNKFGQRFYNEGNGRYWNDNHNAMTANGGVMFSIFDENMKNKLIKEGPLTDFNQIVIRGEPMTALDEGLERGIKAGYAFKADTIEELAEKIGVPVQNLVETVKDINAAADAGEDKLLGRPKQFLFKFSDKGPYYAMRGLRAFFQTLGGVRMNSKMQAMDKKGNVIPGLYAVGMDMGGLYDTSYDIKYPGFTSGFGMTGGLIAGRDAMRLVKESKK